MRAVGDEAKLMLLNSRLILRTGINLNAPRPAQRTDPATIEKALAVLREMGFDLDEGVAKS